MGCQSELLAPADTQSPEDAKHNPEKFTFPQRSIVAERKVIRSAKDDIRALVRRKPVVDRLDVGHDVPRFRIRFAGVIAQQEHERLLKAGLNDAAQWSSVDI